MIRQKERYQIRCLTGSDGYIWSAVFIESAGFIGSAAVDGTFTGLIAARSTSAVTMGFLIIGPLIAMRWGLIKSVIPMRCAGFVSGMDHITYRHLVSIELLLGHCWR